MCASAPMVVSKISQIECKIEPNIHGARASDCKFDDFVFITPGLQSIIPHGH